mmetsp:Transcript_18679/g.30967  ORF Transcript_18679/g.30967 Transcript_18679/m.30967 type:complete len:145 (-) Transcript_18679:124-558(-)|eukprot:CAMPEP_0119010188 /NCGR_PEP_ID=MMETSP1176-20130426/4854_1 /TAXON_ID=265551 /ORGANISM="Synedropsis recta cf, Strain CCMP1620" /LENGTH=144 /DNA_ID=CAMNT_0006962815 /DNA_START=150 /DNA_END=584 /DNA_ORIENTATION=-
MMMKSLILLSVSALLSVASVGAERDEKNDNRRLGGKDLDFNPDLDYCKVGEDAQGRNLYGDCNPDEHFPTCSDKEFVCYNRINRRDKFYPDKVPYYYIDPVRIKCYPTSWLTSGGCSTCTGGRYCIAENRCILDELVYPCAQWL